MSDLQVTGGIAKINKGQQNCSTMQMMLLSVRNFSQMNKTM